MREYKNNTERTKKYDNFRVQFENYNLKEQNNKLKEFKNEGIGEVSQKNNFR